MNSLQTLELRDNWELRAGSPYCSFLKGMNSKRIRSLDLSNTVANALWIGSSDVFCLTQTKLEQLDLLNNDIRGIIIEKYTFWGALPKSLKHLYLQYDNFGCISTNFDGIHTMENLLTLDLSNQNKRIYVNIPGNKEVYTIRETISKNRSDEPKSINLETVTINLSQGLVTQNNRTMDKCLSLPFRLETLNISRSNLLPRIIPLLCHSNNSLRYLNLSSLHERTILTTEKLWKAMKNICNLEELDLSSNKLKEIPTDLVSYNRQLRRPWVHDNSLLSIDLDLKSSLRLELLDLSYNSIQFVSKNFTSSIDTIAKRSNVIIYFQNNSFICNCEHIDFVAWLRYTRVIFDKNSLECTFKNSSILRLRRVVDIHNILKAECISVHLYL